MDRGILDRVLGGYRSHAERVATTFSENLFGSSLLSSLDYWVSHWKDVRLSFVDPSKRGIPNIDELRNDVADMVGDLLVSRYNPTHGTGSELREKKLNYLNSPDLVDGLNNSFDKLWDLLRLNFLQKFKKKLDQTYSPYRYTLMQRRGVGKWDVVDSYLGSPTKREDPETTRNKFMKRMMDEASSPEEQGVISDTFKNKFDETYKVGVVRENLFDQDDLSLRSSDASGIVMDLMKDMFIGYMKDPSKLDYALIKTRFPSESQAKGEIAVGGDKRRIEGRLPLGRVWFRPLTEGSKIEEQEATGTTSKKRGLDKEVARYLLDAERADRPVPWEFVDTKVKSGLDPSVLPGWAEGRSSEPISIRMLEFRLPEFSKTRTFQMPLPPEVSSQITGKNGGGDFRILSEDDQDGFLLQFSGEAFDRAQGMLKEVEERGITPEQFPKFLRTMAEDFVTGEVMGSNLKDILEKYTGKIALQTKKYEKGGEGLRYLNDIGDVEDVVESYMDELQKATDDTDYIELFKDRREREEDLERKLEDTYGPEISQQLRTKEKADPRQVQNRIDAIADHLSSMYPEHADFSKAVGLFALLNTRGMMKFIYKAMMDSTILPQISSGAIEWQKFIRQLLQSDIMGYIRHMERYLDKNELANFFAGLKVLKAKDEGDPQLSGIMQEYSQGRLSVSPQEHAELMNYFRNKFSDEQLKPYLSRLSNQIKESFIDLYYKSDPIITKLFDMTSLGIGPKTRDIRKEIKEKAQEFTRKSEQLEEAIMDKDFALVRSLMAEVGADKKGTLVRSVEDRLNKSSPGEYSEKTLELIDRLVKTYDDAVTSYLKDRYKTEALKNIKSEKDKAASQVYRYMTSGKFDHDRVSSSSYSPALLHSIFSRHLIRASFIHGA